MEHPDPQFDTPHQAAPFTEIDLVSPSWACAWQELAEAGSETGSGDDLAAFGARQGCLLQLSAEAQTELVAVYQHGRRVRRALIQGSVPDSLVTRAKRVVSEAEVATEQLLGSVFRLVYQRVSERARRRFGDRWAAGMMPDLLSDAAASVLAAAVEFDPSKGSKFSSWAVLVLDRDIPKHLSRFGRLNSIPRSWEILSGIAPHVLEELTAELGREPSNDEFAGRLEQRCRSWAREHLTQRELALPGEEQEHVITSRLTRQGIGKVLREEIPQLRQALRAELCLDAPLADTDLSLLDVVSSADAPYDEVAGNAPEILAAGMSHLSPTDRELVMSCFGLGHGDERNARQVGARYGRSESEVRALVRHVRTRLSAPHAQFAFYMGIAASRFEVVDDSDQSAISALRRRRPRNDDIGDALVEMLGLPR